MVPYTITENSISVLHDGDMYSIGRSHTMFEQIKEAIRTQLWDKLPELIDIAKGVRQFLQSETSGIRLEGGAIFYGEEELTGYAVDFILRMQGEGFDVTPLLKYLEKLQSNPSMRNRADQFEWLQRGQMPITPEGFILAFKKVRDDYRDYYSGNFDNSIGKVVEVERRKVDDDIERTCSHGLHFCSRGYLPHYMGNTGRVLIVQIDPADIVAFPRDYNVTKGRCCKYTVIGEIPEDKVGDAFGYAVHSQGSFFEPDMDEELIEDVLPEDCHDYGILNPLWMRAVGAELTDDSFETFVAEQRGIWQSDNPDDLNFDEWLDQWIEARE